MRRSSKPLPRDPNQLAYEVVKLSTEESAQTTPRSPVSEYLAEIGRKGGLKGGRIRAEKLSKLELRKIAKKAAKARWAKKTKK